MVDSLPQVYGNSSYPNDTSVITLHPVQPKHQEESHAVAYVVIPLGTLALVLILAFVNSSAFTERSAVIMMIFRRNRMERLRHHLMPLYNFDPQEEDWESELLDDRGRKMYSKESPGSNTPQLAFNT